MTLMNTSIGKQIDDTPDIERRVAELLDEMSLAEKIGQLSQLDASGDNAPVYLGDALRAGRIGALLNTVDVGVTNELQRIAVEESRIRHLGRIDENRVEPILHRR